MSLFQQHLPPSTTTNGLTYDPATFNPVVAPAQVVTPNPPEKKPKVHAPHLKSRKQKEAGDSEQKGAGNGEQNGALDEKTSGATSNGKQKQDEGEKGGIDSLYVRHPQQGPYMQHRGLSMCTSLGEGVLFYGLDCR
jgi:hypothetical protein